MSAPAPLDVARLHAWVAAELGAPVVDESVIIGGLDARTSRLQLADGRTVVLRVVSGKALSWTSLTRDVAVLQTVGGKGLPLPQLLAADVDGTRAGASALVMSHLPGTTRADIAPATWDAAVSPVLAALAGTPLEGALLDLPDLVTEAVDLCEPYGTLLRVAEGAALWAAFTALPRPDPAGPRVLCHGDVWCGNVLWTGPPEAPVLGGVVDLGDAGLGVPEIDPSVLRGDLVVGHGPDAADALGGPRGRWWDARAALVYLGMLPSWWSGYDPAGIALPIEQAERHLVGYASRLLAA